MVVTIDEGCGKQEDLVAIESAADGILEICIQNGSRLINVVKHPTVSPSMFELPIESGLTMRGIFEINPLFNMFHETPGWV